MRHLLIMVITLLLPLQSSVVIKPKAKLLQGIEEISAKPARQPRLYYCKDYEDVIEVLKKYEGFSRVVYNDRGYACIGHGQRLEFFPNFSIGDTISLQEADYILRLSFNNHIELARHYFPDLNRTQLYAVAHMSYTIGLGTVIEAGYLKKSEQGWYLDQEVLYNYRSVDKKEQYRAIRVYEYNLFNV